MRRIAAVNYDLSAITSELQGDGLAEAGCCACDQSPQALKVAAFGR
jgi:hypothetical protein